MSWLYSWFWDIFSLFSYTQKARIVFVGLDFAGKTTLLHLLRDGRLHEHPPTFHPTSEELSLNHIRLTAHDVGGHESARQIWKNYTITADGIVFLVDASARHRFTEAKKELDGLLTIPDLKNVPFVILGTKIDLPSANEEELRYALGLDFLTTGKNKDCPTDIRPIELFMCSMHHKVGYYEAFTWLAYYLK